MQDDLRRRARNFSRKNADNWTEDDVENLVEFALSERAAALGAVEAIVCETIDECENKDYVAWDTLETVLIERIRAALARMS